ncbi:MAG: PEP-utilizing enzyme [Betaproteobacteria bacterium]
MTRYLQEAFPDGFIRGFQSGTACFGLLLDHIEPGFVNGFFYNKKVIVGAPANAKGPPPKLVFKLMCRLHPQMRRRLKTAATVLQRKPWRDHLKHWDMVLKPQSTAKHLRLQSRDLTPTSDAELAAYVGECFENSKAMAFQHHIYTVTFGVVIGDYLACTHEWTGLPFSEISQALKGSTPISSGVTDEYLAALRAIAADADAARILNGSDAPAEKLQRLQVLPGATGEAVKAYLDLASYRVVGGYDITCRTAIETPDILVNALQYVHSPDARARDDAAVAQLVAKIRSVVPEEHRAQFDDVFREARLINRLRDERAYWSDLWSSGISRRALLEAGRRLAAKRKIDAAEHALDATCSEVQALLTGSGPPAPTAEELALRYHFRVSVPNDVAPPFLNGVPAPPPPVEWFPRKTQRTMRAMGTLLMLLFGAGDRKSEGKTVRGISVSSGRYEGRARLIDNIDELGLIRKGEVLVTRSTSTAFNYVLPLVGAIVTDRGGLMSHAAIVAREYGLPGVVGCQTATRTIPDGAMVRVDADKGEVTILS